jgi:LmbE family N-acetylglucosaminyl deacetylase
MLITTLARNDRPLRVLCIGAHSDDIEIGCGGAVLRLAQDYQRLAVRWVVLSGSAQRAAEARASAAAFLRGVADAEIQVASFRDGHFPYSGAELKAYIEQLKSFQPDLIFTHCGRDMHQDHRTVCELTWNTFRDHLILEYEIPKYDGDLASPNLFVALPRSLCEAKVGLLLEHFGSQRSRRWFTDETFFATLRLRGVECQSAEGYAEGFYCRKLVI